MTSSTTPGSTRWRHSRQTSGWVRRTKDANATRSPSAAARASRVRSSTTRCWQGRGAGNSTAPRNDLGGMDCRTAFETMSADLDGELSELESQALAAHLLRCPACRAMQRDLLSLHRAVRVRPAEPAPDLVAPIMDRVELPRPRRRTRPGMGPVRAARRGDDPTGRSRFRRCCSERTPARRYTSPASSARSTQRWRRGSWWRPGSPQRAAGLLPFGVALTAATLLTGLIDVLGGRAPAAGEAHHVLDLVGVGFLWLVTKVDVRPSLRRSGLRLT